MNANNSMYVESNEFGTIEVTTLPLPEDFRKICATYTASGKVFLSYQLDSDPKDANWIHFARMEDDGSQLTQLFEGPVVIPSTANGMRLMPFQDNQRIFIGDYILEAKQENSGNDLDTCHELVLIPLIYPDWLMKAEGLWFHWSEMIIAPDHRTISWTTLGSEKEGVYLGLLRREADHYEIDEIRNISTPMHFGGEVKQFVHGGRAISLVGAGYGIAGPVVQHLDREELTMYCPVPGYEETLMFSPDEKLGLVMSTRFSPKTNFSILYHLPRPHIQGTLSGLAMPTYCYGVSDVRNFREGNIGPVLIDIEKDRTQPGYMGVSLHDPKEPWVYCSPISWHPTSSKVMWLEVYRDPNAVDLNLEIKRSQRVRIAKLNQSISKPFQGMGITPSEVPYGRLPEESTSMRKALDKNRRIIGKYSGWIDKNGTQTSYHNFSDDGLTFWNGTEQLHAPKNYFGKTVYEGSVRCEGAKNGKMDLRLEFDVDPSHCYLNTTLCDNGKPASYGYAEYEGLRLTVEELL